MTIEEAIKTAIEYEIKVRDIYLDNVDAIGDPAGKKIFKVLGDEEQGHIDYLESRLTEWQKTGQLSLENLATVVPSRATIDSGVKQLTGQIGERDLANEQRLLEKALDLEEATSAFYRRMVAEVDQGKELFQRFIEIEEGHEAIVQTELDVLNRNGMFFDFLEYNME